jgi:methylated-DNA-[protein]-cysteine S-methyltransferase
VKASISLAYDLIPSPFGEIGLVQRHEGGQFQVKRVFLPQGGVPALERIREGFPGALPAGGDRGDVSAQIRAFLAGEIVDFSIARLDFEGLGGFARRVLLADSEIARGRVMTYGGLAAKLDLPGGARAVGNALARNPFPIVIPCHRVIRNDGRLGGFGGGLPMKRRLLEMEGVVFDERGRVLPGHILLDKTVL